MVRARIEHRHTTHLEFPISGTSSGGKPGHMRVIAKQHASDSKQKGSSDGDDRSLPIRSDLDWSLGQMINDFRKMHGDQPTV
jgi:hypothetical protein